MATVKLTIDKDELKKILTERIELEYQRKVVRVEVNVITQYDDRPGGSSYPMFQDIEITLGDKIVQKYGPHDR